VLLIAVFVGDNRTRRSSPGTPPEPHADPKPVSPPLKGNPRHVRHHFQRRGLPPPPGRLRVIAVVVGAVAGAAVAPLVLAVADRFRRRRDSVSPVDVRVRKPLIALLAVLSGAAVGKFGSSWLTAAFAVFAVAAVTAAAVDLAELRLPDVLMYPLLVGGLVLILVGAVTGWLGDPWRAVAAGALYGGWMLVVALIAPGGYGLGDVKLAAAVGLWLGLLSWLTVATAMLYGQVFVVATLLAVRLYRRHRPGAAGLEAPLGPALVAGAVLALLVG
jgi:leader peptidase (prepilin peptidase)/N-methyltransferase